MILSLDLSSSCTGYTLLDPINDTYIVDKITPTQKSTFRRIWNTVNEIKKLYPKVTEVVIEDTFSGINKKSVKVLDRLGGAVIYSWIEYSKSEPTMVNAVSARKLVGLDPQISKAESQLWIIANFFPKISIKQFSVDKVALRKSYVNRKITKSQWKYRIDKLSNEIAEQTGIDNNMADSMILALAYLKKVYNKTLAKG